ncbi:phage neck terminator protein [Serratia fonticola]
MITTSVTEDDLMTALGGFLTSVSGWEVVQSQANDVPMPKRDFITMTSINDVTLSTNRITYTDAPGAGTQNFTRSVQWDVQVDCYGEKAKDITNTLAALMRSDYACTALAETPIQPLYAGEPHNTTMVNGEQLYESRWTVDVHFQFNPTVSTPMEFADQLNTELVSVDATYPPGSIL